MSKTTHEGDTQQMTDGDTQSSDPSIPSATPGDGKS